MPPQIISIDNLDAIRSAAEQIRTGAVVAARTDTNYGLFTTPFNRESCARLYEMKGRDQSKPLSIFISGPSEWSRWGYRPQHIDIDRLIDTYWPGPLNLILKKKSVIPDWVTSNKDTVSIVYNDSPAVNLLSLFSGLPLAATSANLSGTMDGVGLVDFQTAMEHIGGHVDYIIHDDSPQETTMSSTIVDLTSEHLTVVRQGDLHLEPDTWSLPMK